MQRRTTADINDMARSQGMLTLFEDGLQKVKNGLSTIEELLRIAAPPDTFLPTSLPTSHEPVQVPKDEKRSVEPKLRQRDAPRGDHAACARIV